MTKQDLDFYAKLRLHANEPLDGRISTKTRHLFYSSDQEDSETLPSDPTTTQLMNDDIPPLHTHDGNDLLFS